MTQRQLETIARRAFPGMVISVRHYKTALIGAKRNEATLRRALCRASIKTIDEEFAKRRFAWVELVAAAKFVVDVNGDSPSIPQLATVLLDAQRSLDLKDEKARMVEEEKRLGIALARAAWEVLKRRKDDIGWHVVAWCDTAADCAAKITGAT